MEWSGVSNQVLDRLDLEATVGPASLAGLGGQSDSSHSPLYPRENTLVPAGLASFSTLNNSHAQVEWSGVE